MLTRATETAEELKYADGRKSMNRGRKFSVQKVRNEEHENKEAYNNFLHQVL